MWGGGRRRHARRVGHERARIDRQRLADLLDELAEMWRLQQIETAGAVLGRVAPAVLRVADEDPLRDAVFVGILDEKLDDFNRKVFVPQIDGSKTGLELPGIVDEVLTLTSLPDDKGVPQRVFVCHTQNSWGYPAKDRSGRLDLLEPPHLGRLIEKIRQPLPIDARPLVTDEPRIPAPAATPQSDPTN